MSYKQPTQNGAGWQQAGQQLPQGMWPPSAYMAPFSQPFAMQNTPQINGDMQPTQPMFLNNRTAFDRGMMGPPPIPQKSVSSGMPTHPLMYPGGFSPHVMGNNVNRFHLQSDIGSGAAMPRSDLMQQPSRPIAPPSHSPMHPTFGDKNGLLKTHFGNLHPGAAMFNNPLAQTALGKPGQKDALLEPNDMDSKNFEDRLHEIFSSTPPTNGAAENIWNPRTLPLAMPPNQDKPVALLPTSTSGLQNPHGLSHLPNNLPNDLKNVQPAMFSSDLKSTGVSTVPIMDNAGDQPPAVAQVPSALPLSDNLLPPMGAVQQNIFMEQDMKNADEADKDKPKRKRRKRCGICEPCRLQEDCGHCYVCRNKGQVNAICKSRKCMMLRNKNYNPDSGSVTSNSSGSSNHTTSSTPTEHGMMPHGRPVSPLEGTSPPQMLSTAATAESDTTLSNQRMLPQQQQLMQMRQSPAPPTISGYPTFRSITQGNGYNPHQRALGGPSNNMSANLPSPFRTKQNIFKQKPTIPAKPIRHYNGPSTSTLPTPWDISDNHDNKPTQSGWPKPSRGRPVSSEKLDNVYSTFRDDMQKMNERTYVRANGVKVCKLMTKLLNLNLTDEELKSAQPPKPKANAWEQYFPDCKPSLRSLSRTDSADFASPVDSPVPAKVKPDEIVPREIVTHRVSDPEAVNSQGTVSDIEGDTNSRSTDIQAADSGFSSSSPADRQSPSPKVWFPLTLTEQTKAEPAELNITSLPGTNTTTSDIRSTIEPDTHIGGSTAPITAPEANIDSNVGHNVMDTSPTNINSCPENTRVTTQVLDKPSREPAAFTDGAVTPIGVDGALDLSSNSTSFPRMHLPPEMAIDQSTPQQSYNNPSAGPTNPPRLLASSVQTQQLFNQQMKVDAFMPTPLDLHAPTKPTVSSLNNLLETLAAQVTGDASGSHQSEAAKRETNAEQDAANLVKLNKKAEPPNCGCTNRPFDENVEGPFYVHLGSANSLKAIRTLMEERTGYAGNTIRIEKVRFTSKEGRTSLGCPAAKWIVRRSSLEEKVLVITKHRSGHYCPTAWLVVAIVVWEGVPAQAANHMYDYLTRTMPVYGYETERRCGTNQPRDCACQGWDMNRKGASFSFGCSWSVYYNGCKFARSHIPRKFKLRDVSFEGVMESKFQALGQYLAPLYKQMAPLSYGAQVRYESKAGDCRIGFRTGRPFSGCTATVDFCAHQHRDTHNMNNGCTVVVTLTKHRGMSRPDDEQLHTLPTYCLEDTDEHGSPYGIQHRIDTGALEILNAYSEEQRRRSRPYKKRKKGSENYQSPKVKQAFIDAIREKMMKEKTMGIKPDANFQQPQVPVPQERELAKQDLFNTQTTQATPQSKPIWSPHQQISTSVPPPSPGILRGYPAVTAPLQPGETQLAYPPHRSGSFIPPSTPSHPPTETFSMEQHVRQHIQHAHLMQQMQQQQKSQHQNRQQIDAPGIAPPPPRLSPPVNPNESLTPTPQSVAGSPPIPPLPMAGVENDSETTAKQEATVSMETIDELNPPKPRPPSPEYDDPDRKDVHEDNSHLFRDRNVGGVALALSHGAVLFEVAKRELHATTALRQPDRYNPTRISLVFYQHKRLNFTKHGMQEYRKAEEERQKARNAATAAGIEYVPKGLKYKQKRVQEAALRKSRIVGGAGPRGPIRPTPSIEVQKTKFGGIRKKPGRKPGWKQRKHLKFAAYQYMWPCPVNHPRALTSESVVTNWVKGDCLVTGPYHRWVSLHTPPHDTGKTPLSISTSAPPPSSHAGINSSSKMTTPMHITNSVRGSAVQPSQTPLMTNPSKPAAPADSLRSLMQVPLPPAVTGEVQTSNSVNKQPSTTPSPMASKPCNNTNQNTSNNFVHHPHFASRPITQPASNIPQFGGFPLPGTRSTPPTSQFEGLPGTQSTPPTQQFGVLPGTRSTPPTTQFGGLPGTQSTPPTQQFGVLPGTRSTPPTSQFGGLPGTQSTPPTQQLGVLPGSRSTPPTSQFGGLPGTRSTPPTQQFGVLPGTRSTPPTQQFGVLPGSKHTPPTQQFGGLPGTQSRPQIQQFQRFEGANPLSSFRLPPHGLLSPEVGLNQAGAGVSHFQQPPQYPQQPSHRPPIINQDTIEQFKQQHQFFAANKPPADERKHLNGPQFATESDNLQNKNSDKGPSHFAMPYA